MRSAGRDRSGLVSLGYGLADNGVGVRPDSCREVAGGIDVDVGSDQFDSLVHNDYAFALAQKKSGAVRPLQPTRAYLARAQVVDKLAGEPA